MDAMACRLRLAYGIGASDSVFPEILQCLTCRRPVRLQKIQSTEKSLRCRHPSLPISRRDSPVPIWTFTDIKPHGAAWPQPKLNLTEIHWMSRWEEKCGGCNSDTAGRGTESRAPAIWILQLPDQRIGADRQLLGLDLFPVHCEGDFVDAGIDLHAAATAAAAAACAPGPPPGAAAGPPAG